jgi:mitochondrial fission protein ELM1
MSQVNEKKPVLWVITEGMAGTENQCLGVAESLGLTPVVKRVALRQPWKTLSPWMGFETAATFVLPLTAPWPDILITAGRKAVAAARYIKKQSGGKTFTVHLQDPRVSPRHFDLLAVPFHDRARGDNVIVTDGAPNRITAEQLAAAKEKFEPLFTPLKSPRIAVMIGGNSRTHTLTPDIVMKLCAQLHQLDAGFMITASRRTGQENLKILRTNLPPSAFLWDNQGDNPYFGMLAWADHIVVTADSVSMISDAGTTGKPVHVVPLEGRSAKFDTFHAHLRDIGVTRPFTGDLTPWTYPRLNDAGRIADAIRQRFSLYQAPSAD